MISSDLAHDYYPPALHLANFRSLAWDQWNAWHVRLGLLIPLALAQVLTEKAELAIIVAALPFSIAQLIIVFTLAKILWNNTAGLLAATFEAVYPVTVIFGVQPLPDTVMSYWVALSMLIFVVATKRSQDWLFLLSGICIGLAYTAKITSLFPGLVLIFFAIRHARKILGKEPLLVATGGIIVLIIETIVLSYLHGEFNLRLINMLSASSDYSNGIIFVPTSRYIPGFFSMFFWPFNRDLIYHGFFGYAIIGSIIYLYRCKEINEGVSLMISWWLGSLLLINFASLGFSRPFVYGLYARYLMFITPPGVLLVSFAVLKLHKTLYQLILCATLVASSLICAYALHRTAKPHDSGYRHLYEVILRESTQENAIYFQRPILAEFATVFIGSNREHVVTTGKRYLDTARPGDLATLIIDNYNRKDELPEGYIRTLSNSDWKLIDDWRYNPGFVADLFETLGINTNKGFAKHIRVFRKSFSAN